MATKTSIDVVIPIYNEELELAANIKKLHTYLSKNLHPQFAWRITIADNASTDNSLSIAKKLTKDLPNVSYIHLNEKGRGRAVKKAWKESKGKILLYMDVDLSTDLHNLHGLIRALESGYDIAIGSRLSKKAKVANRPLKREILSRGYNILIKLFFQTHFSDAQCGFKGITKKAVKNLLPYIKDDAWFFDSELLIVSEKLGYKIYEEPVHWVDNPGSTVRVLRTVTGDLLGLARLFFSRPWELKTST
ncbi:glycosyltransferase family 2 protein [Candidatus Gottesmanbacteria bacterium]|nr:glycosyltransferase family 2 protein [Candidatus Gottesmanbacteria bacterium]